MIDSFLAGIALGLSLIIAIGAQNLFVLRQGLKRQHVLLIATICTLSDAVLIAVGVSGIGALLNALPGLIGVVRWVGAAFLVGYGLLALRRAFRPASDGLAGVGTAYTPTPGASTTATATRTRTIVLTVLALTWLNPHVYLDTVFLLGSIATTHGDQRWVFAAGAMLGSAIWFSALAFGARLLSRWLARPRVWRVLDTAFAVIMIALGISLVLPH